MGKLLGNKFFVIAGGLVVLIALGIVLGLTVVRIRNLQPTITQPKAYTAWPQCARTGPYACTDSDCFNSGNPKRDITKCCDSVKTDPFACEWPARGFCRPDQCPDSGGQRCSLYYLNTPECTATQPPTNNTYYKAISPIGGVTASSLTPTLVWEANTTGINYNNVYVSQNASCNYDAATGQWFEHVPLTSRQVTVATALQPNTTYYWNIYGDGPAGIHGAGCASFRTPAAPATHFECVNKTCAVVSGAGDNKNGCTAAGGTCCASSADCSSGQTCDATKTPNSCVASATHFECVNKTCTAVSGAGDNENGCTAAGSSCCASDTDCTSGQSCDTTKTPNKCEGASQVSACWGNNGADGRCYDCNGDGEVNILDFSCFRAAYLKNVQ